MRQRTQSLSNQNKPEARTSIRGDHGLRRSRAEAIAINALIPCLSVFSMAICVLPGYGVLPAWVVFLLNVSLTTQIVALTHELIHEPRAQTRANLPLRINFHVYSPFTVGFDEYRTLHLLHHKYSNSGQDPDYFMVKGGRLRSFLYLCFAPEYWFFYVLFHKKTQPHFVPLYLMRLLVLGAFIYIAGWQAYVLLFFIPAKLSYGLSFFIFSHEAHTDHEGKREGVYNLRVRFPLIHRSLKLIIGPYAYHIAHHHANHHEYPWVSGRKLGLISERVAEAENAGGIATRRLFY
jgi:fatty acid desaturase